MAAPGDDILRPGNDRVVGDDGCDVLRGDAIIGGAGNDKARLGRDRPYGADGRDRIWGDTATTIETHLGGGDFLYGQGASDRLYGEWGSDRHVCGAGHDVANGGPSQDSQVSCEVTHNIP